ncbi:oxygen-insensitive NADPH nitroreductase [Salisediminibacterium halotolerans]|uniref:oxygen-insensitive NADPH nitroreductase n=1 Tax=Salisediminibacterium halotolerans TaxID=517425 RepID=UPI000EB10BE4|nr:oxygen-insensitive NADPH nitroreductase [Salisediminibacterium halotolerans]RLJ75751.1 nitroreductase [Actinophytocola xinjiangensis]RPE89605.1 nitroreductase [Salisediminibacterium halotolerans]TWG36364.1 nitroreductase [Salisediminibacterium halotolerans]GEL08898.1 NADPH-dependent oxidoreductase [Salisediminibacterium halotolerans]
MAHELPQTVQLMKNHRSIRQFTDQPVDDATFREIIFAAQRAPSSHHVQAYSIVHVTDPDKRATLARVAGGQQYVNEAPVFLVFVADFWKHEHVCIEEDSDFQIDETENVLVGTVDAALAAQNALTAAESFGLGGVMIGGIRNHPRDVRDCLDLPRYTFPVMGLCLGYAAEVPEQKPRLPLEMILHTNTYCEKPFIDGRKNYDEEMAHYYQTRSANQKEISWSKQMSDYFAKVRRPEVTTFLTEQGFALK